MPRQFVVQRCKDFKYWGCYVFVENIENAKNYYDIEKAKEIANSLASQDVGHCYIVLDAILNEQEYEVVK